LNCRTEIQNVEFRIPRKEFLSLHQCVSQILYILDRNEEETTVDVEKVGGILVKTTDAYTQVILYYHH
jgi:frataxin-like iron-binding protein CyaY